MKRDDAAFVAFADARSRALRRTAYLLAGDWHAAEDIVQVALIKVYKAWPRVEPATAEAYARTAVVRVFLDSRRRRASRELPVMTVPDTSVSGTSSHSRLDLLNALRALPPGQRAVVVLRYWDDASVEQTAAVLGLSHGTVKSQSAKGLQALREVLGADYSKETR